MSISYHLFVAWFPKILSFKESESGQAMASHRKLSLEPWDGIFLELLEFELLLSVENSRKRSPVCSQDQLTISHISTLFQDIQGGWNIMESSLFLWRFWISTFCHAGQTTVFLSEKRVLRVEEIWKSAVFNSSANKGTKAFGGPSSPSSAATLCHQRHRRHGGSLDFAFRMVQTESGSRQVKRNYCNTNDMHF